MMEQNDFNVVELKQGPWNKGQLVGKKPALQAEHVSAIRAKLQDTGSIRDLALFELAIDSKLRGCDLVSLKVEDIAPYGYAVDDAKVDRVKTGRPGRVCWARSPSRLIKFEISEKTCRSVDDYLRATDKAPGDFLFTGRQGKDRCLSTRQYARLVSRWIESIGLDASLYGTHSLGRTKEANIPMKGEAGTTPKEASGINHNGSKREATPEYRPMTDSRVSEPKVEAEVENVSVKTPEMNDVPKTVGNPLKVKEPFPVRLRLVTGLLVISVLVLAAGGWAATAQLSGAIIAQGSLVVERYVKKVQHLDGGIVAEINVVNGDVVKAGDVLIKLDDTRDRAEFGVIQSQIIDLSGRVARLSAERDGLTVIDFSPEFDAMGPGTIRVRNGETRLFNSNREANKSVKDQLRIRIGQHQEEIRALASQSNAKKSELILIRKELAQVSKLFSKKLVPVTRIYTLEREATRIDGEYGGLEAKIAGVLGKISEIKIQILAVDQTMKRDAQREIREIEAKIAELAERKVAVVYRLSRVEMRAPVDGVVHELAVHTVGGVITPAESVMLIVPANEELTIEARIMPNDIDQVGADQEVRVRLSAFNQRATTELKGRVINVAADVTQEPRSGQSYYLARIEIDKESLEQIVDWKLVPGMPVEVFITTGERTVLAYLAKPITDQLERSFRDD